MAIKTTAVQTTAAVSAGPDGIDPETCAKVLRWAWKETGLDILRSMAAQQEGRAEYLGKRDALTAKERLAVEYWAKVARGESRQGVTARELVAILNRIAPPVTP